VYVPEGVEVDMRGLSLFGHARANGNDPPPRPGTPLVRVFAVSLWAGIDAWRVPLAWAQRKWRDGDQGDPERGAQATRSLTWTVTLKGMEGGGFGFPLGGDPEDLLRGLREFAEQQAETVQEAQREQFATLTLNTAVDLTAAALKRMSVEGPSDAQAIALRDAMRVLFPEAVALVSAARQGFMRE
jgi:hypothetical protein